MPGATWAPAVACDQGAHPDRMKRLTVVGRRRCASPRIKREGPSVNSRQRQRNRKGVCCRGRPAARPSNLDSVNNGQPPWLPGSTPQLLTALHVSAW